MVDKERMNPIQYRLKIIDSKGAPRENFKEAWMSSKLECLSDFMQKPRIPQGEEKIYVYKRIQIPDRKRYFRIIGKRKYQQFRWKVKCQWNVYHPSRDQEPAWTLIEGDCTDGLEKCSKDFRDTIGEYYLDYCLPYEYVYMRRPFPIRVKGSRSHSV